MSIAAEHVDEIERVLSGLDPNVNGASPGSSRSGWSRGNPARPPGGCRDGTLKALRDALLDPGKEP